MKLGKKLTTVIKEWSYRLIITCQISTDTRKKNWNNFPHKYSYFSCLL